MSSPVYSVQLAAHVNYTGTLDVFVPDGYKYVVRDIDVFWNASSDSSDLLFKGNPGNIIYAFIPVPGASGQGSWRGRQVFETSQKFTMQWIGLGTRGFDFQVSGYQLTLP